jgi:hypothetical protein
LAWSPFVPVNRYTVDHCLITIRAPLTPIFTALGPKLAGRWIIPFGLQPKVAAADASCRQSIPQLWIEILKRVNGYVLIQVDCDSSIA